MARTVRARQAHRRLESHPSPTQDFILSPDTYHIFTDGSHRPPDFAAYAYLIFSSKTKHIVKMGREACKGMTINQMELMGINKALDHPGMRNVIIYSDSAYAIGCLSQWCHAWARNDWMARDDQPVKNVEIIRDTLAKMERIPSVKFVKIKAHSGNLLNSVVDFLAQELTNEMRTNSSHAEQ